MLVAGFVVRKDGERGVVVTVDGMTNAPHGGAVGQVGSLYHPNLVSWVRLPSYNPLIYISPKGSKISSPFGPRWVICPVFGS